MKEKKRTILFILVLFSLTMVNLLKPTSYFSYKENRYLQTRPKLKYKDLINGKFGKDFEDYTSDQFIGRNFWIASKTLTDLGLGKKDNGRVYFGKDSYLIDKDETLNEEQFKKNMDNIKAFIGRLGPSRRINIMLIPSKGQVLGDKVPKHAPLLDEKQLFYRIREELSPISQLKLRSLWDSLATKSEEYIYYRTDHHWTSRGAFYAYQDFLRSMEMIPLEEEDFIVSRVSDDFLGTSYRKANLYFGDPDEIHKYSPKEEVDYSILVNGQLELEDLYDQSYLEKTDKYSYFLGGDKALIEISTSLKNGKSILVFKDSFANSFIPFLLNHYEKIILLDSRYFNYSPLDLIEKEEIEDILFLYNIENFIGERSFNIFGR